MEGRRRGLGPETNASVRQMPVSGRIPRSVERGTDDLAAEARTLSGLAFRLSACMPFGRGWQATGQSGGGPSRVAFVPECFRTAQESVWLPEGTVYGRRLVRVRSLVEGDERGGCVALVVSLDVVNASTASPRIGYAGPSSFIGYPRIYGEWSGHFSGTVASSTPSEAGG